MKTWSNEHDTPTERLIFFAKGMVLNVLDVKGDYHFICFCQHAKKFYDFLHPDDGVNEISTQRGYTPLGLSVQNRHLETTKALVEFGADPFDNCNPDENPYENPFCPYWLALGTYFSIATLSYNLRNSSEVFNATECVTYNHSHLQINDSLGVTTNVMTIYGPIPKLIPVGFKEGYEVFADAILFAIEKTREETEEKDSSFVILHDQTIKTEAIFHSIKAKKSQNDEWERNGQKRDFPRCYHQESM